MKAYQKAGVNVAAGDAASALAGRWAATTFAARAKSKIGRPITLPGGFAGALDFGKFLLVVGDDGTGTKMAVAEKLRRFDTLGADLLAMVADDAVCLGAEVVAITNTLDVPKVEKQVVNALLRGLAKSCRAQKIAITGGEIAEVGSTVRGLIWNATAVGVVEKKKLIDGSRIRAGDAVIALRENGLRSNGFTLARAILRRKFGTNWERKKWGGKSWGGLLLTPSCVYHSAILGLVGRFGEKSKVVVRGIAHITGGGIPGNLPRILRHRKLGARLPDLWPAPDWVAELVRLGKVSAAEARQVWCLGNGMLVIVAKKDAEKTVRLLRKSKVAARVAGEITAGGGISF